MEGIGISQVQKQFWLLQKVYRNNVTYNIPVVLKFNGVPEIQALEYALRSVVLRHEALRMRFVEAGDDVVAEQVNIEEIHIRVDKIRINKPLIESQIPGEIMAEINLPFDIDSWPLFRVRLFTFTDNRSFLTIVFHHIVVDLRSKEIFAEDFSEFYNSFRFGYPPRINDISGRYSDYLEHYAGWINSPEAEKMKMNWKSYISQAPEMLEMPADFPRPRINSQEGSRTHFYLGNELYAKALNYAGENNIKDFTFFLTAYAILLHRLTGQDRILIGVPFTNRRWDQFSETFGCFVNILPVEVNFDFQVTGTELIRQIRYSLLRIHRMQEIPFLALNEMLKNTSGNPIFQAGFTYEPPVNMHFADIESEPVNISRSGSQLDLFLTLWTQDEDLNGFMEYSTLLFKDETASRFIGIYRQIIKSFLENPGLPVSELDIIAPEESHLIMRWNSTDHEYSRNICLHHRFEQQVLITPDAPAILFGKESLSYGEFNSHANRMANYLLSLGVKTEDIVCVCMERSIELMIAIFGIHKAGAAYLPVDPGYPADRLGMMLSDARPVFILTKRQSETNLPEGFRRVYLDDILNSPLSEDEKNPQTDVTSGNLAYLMYTSGSTGVPKGVMIEHHSVINKLEWMQFRHPLDQKDTILLKTPVTFDVSVWELFWWTFSGSKMAILPPGGERDPGTIIDEVDNRKVTTIVFVPSMFSPFIGYIKARSAQVRLQTLKWIIQIGEPLTPQLVSSFNELRTPGFDPLMVNTYGPTEATVAVSWYDCPKGRDVDKIYIGRPIFNTRLLVLNKRNKIQPVGVPGELVITGVNLSRGYLNRPELNSERFITFRYPDGTYLRGYRTGDLVRLLSDGNIDFIGRTDNQVKIRGYRIELGEIEARLLEHPSVKSAVVVVKELSQENRTIAGYVVIKENQPSDSEEIRKFLASHLPDYMVPRFIMILGSMPLNTSGKIDRKSLPSPQFVSGTTQMVPASLIETQLLGIWKETIGQENIGINQNFFDMGGNSLLAVHIVNLIKERLNLRVEPINLLEYPTIRSLAAFISDQGKESRSDVAGNSGNINVRKQSFSTLQKKRNELLRNQ